MAKARIRLKKLPKLSPKQQVESLRQETRKLLQPVADRRANEYASAVSDWQDVHKPDFKGQVIVGRVEPRLISIRVILINFQTVFNKYGTKIGNLWQWWNRGTRPHIITPRGKSQGFADILRFVIDGRTIFTPLVNHPGTKGTEAKNKIDKRLAKLERRAIDRAYKKAFKKVEKLNKN